MDRCQHGNRGHCDECDRDQMALVKLSAACGEVLGTTPRPYRPPRVRTDLGPKFTETEARLRSLLREIGERFKNGASVDLDGFGARIKAELER